MLLITHIALGLLLGSATHTFKIAFLLGFLSHFILDAIPHWDPKLGLPPGQRIGIDEWKSQPMFIKKQVLVLTIIHIAVAFLILKQIRMLDNIAYVLMGAFAAMLPALYEWFSAAMRLPGMHFFSHRHMGWKLGVPVQAAIIAICVAML